MQKVYKDFGFTDIIYKVATRPEQRIGTDESWDKAEHALMESLRASGVEFQISEGEGAFYGPKIEYTLKDALGREWQVGTMQVDPNLPERLDAEYVGEDGARHRPVMLHRAIFGSYERFIGILIEHYAGAFPVWIAPLQVKILPITDRNMEYAQTLANKLREADIRVEVDERSEKIGYKIREAQMEKVPYMLVLGDKEAEAGMVAVRVRGQGDVGTMTFEAFEKMVNEAIANKA